VEWSLWKMKSIVGSEVISSSGRRVSMNHISAHHEDHHNDGRLLDEIESRSGPSSPKLLNLSLTNSGSPDPSHPLTRRPGASRTTTNTNNMPRNSSRNSGGSSGGGGTSSRRRTPPRPEPQTAPSSTTTTGHSPYTNHLTHQHHPQPDSSPPFPRRKQVSHLHITPYLSLDQPSQAHENENISILEFNYLVVREKARTRTRQGSFWCPIN